jgi:hypothetical protein
MVLPGDELTVKLHHISMRDGNVVVNIETSNARGEKVIQGSAEVSQSSTVYVFTGPLAKAPKNPAWVWTCTIVLLLLVLFGKVPMPTSSLFMGSRLLPYRIGW